MGLTPEDQRSQGVQTCGGAGKKYRDSAGGVSEPAGGGEGWSGQRFENVSAGKEPCLLAALEIGAVRLHRK